MYTKSRGWCVDQKGKSNYDYQTVEGNFPTGEDCANEVKKFMVYGGATYNPESKECLSLTGQAVKGGPESKNYYCFAFKARKASKPNFASDNFNISMRIFQYLMSL